jgi:hypothetical protein
MKNRTIFWESFLDGFTMAGFLGRLERPGAPTALCAPSQTTLRLPLSEEGAKSCDFVIEGDLGRVSEESLHAVMELLQREDDARKRLRSSTQGSVHAAAR